MTVQTPETPSPASDEEPQKALPSVPLTALMRYATTWDWFLLIVGLVASVGNGMAAPLSLLAFRDLQNAQMEAQSKYSNNSLDLDWFRSEMFKWNGGMLAFAVVLFTVGFSSTYLLLLVSERQIYRIKTQYLKRILSQEIAWFQQNEVGSLTQKMSSGIERIRDGTGDKIVFVVQAITNTVMGLVVGFIMSWQISVLMLFVMPLVVASLWGAAVAIKSSVRREMAASAAANAVAEEVLSGHSTVAAFNAQNFETERYDAHLRTAYRNGLQRGTWTAMFSGSYDIVEFGSMGAAVWLGTNLVIDGKTSPGTIMAVFWAVICGTGRLGKAIPIMGIMARARLAAAELFAVIDREPKMDSTSPRGICPPTREGNIEFKNVRFTYPSRSNIPVLRGISFSVKAGESVAFVGHSGCGKSTIVNLLMRFYEPNSGLITLDGNPLNELNIEWLRNTIGVVSQEPVVFGGTIAENLRLGREDLTEEEMLEACRMANAHEFIATLPHGYSTVIGDGGVRLSGGQKQRLAIARTLVRNPRILLLDEATSALDTASERAVQAAIEAASTGRTTIAIAHRLSTIRNADRIFVFDSGQIVESGTHDELLKNGKYYKQLVAAQQLNEESRHRKLSAEKQKPEESSSEINAEIGPKWPSKLHSDTSERRSPRRSLRSTLNQEREQLRDEGGIEPSFCDIFLFARPEHRFIGPGVVAAAIRGLAWPIYAIIIGEFFKTMSAALASNNGEYLREEGMIDGALLAGLGVISCGLCFGAGVLLVIGGERFTKRLRLAVFRNLLRQDGAFFDDERRGVAKLCTRLACDAPNVQAAVDQRLAEVLAGLVALACGLGIGFYFGWKMALIELAASSVFVGLQLWLVELQKRRATADAAESADAFKIASEAIEYVKTVQALTRQQYVYDRFCEYSFKLMQTARKRFRLQALLYGLISSVEEFHFGVAYLLGYVLVATGNASPFTVFQVIEAVHAGLMGFFVVATYVPEYLRARVAAGMMFQMLRQEPKIDSMASGGRKSDVSGRVSFRGVYFSYPNVPGRLILRDFTAEVDCGQTLALVGASGCGKSTTIQLLERFYDPVAGAVEVDGIDIREVNLGYLRERMAVVGQEPFLFNLTVAQNIAYGMGEKVETQRIIEAARLANIHSFVDSLPLKYQTPVGARGSQLSGGQKQRIAIARAIIRDPKILLLDEATSALDTESEKLVQEALDRASEGRTVITIAHRLSTIKHADIIAVVSNGSVEEAGRHDELIEADGLYAKLVHSQTG